MHSQTLGGSSAYTFLKLPSTSILTATGGVNTSYITNDIGFALNNAALLNSSMHGQLSASFNAYFAGIQAYNMAGGYHDAPSKTTFGANIFFINYGQITQTDAAGNISGNFHPVDYAVQLSAAKNYLQKWHYGISLKYINSRYAQYQSSAIACDIGVLYLDSAQNFSASIAAKSMGVPIKSYAATKEDMPFDLQIGITKKLNRAPLAFSLTAHHIHQFDLTYNDTLFNTDNNFANNHSKINNVLNHLVFATHIFISPHLEAHIGYNFLRRSELNLGSSGNGLNGFSTGLAAKFQKLQVQYARAYFQKNIAYNQFGLIVSLDKLFGLNSL